MLFWAQSQALRGDQGWDTRKIVSRDKNFLLKLLIISKNLIMPQGCRPLYRQRFAEKICKLRMVNMKYMAMIFDKNKKSPFLYFCSCSYYCTLQKVWQNSVIIFSHQEERSQQSWQGRVLIRSPGTPMLTFGQHKKPSILIFNRCTIRTLFQEISLVKNEFSKFTQFHLWNNRGTFISSPW